MNNLIVSKVTDATMSSREIAELTGKEHAHVMRDIRNILIEAEIDESNFGGIYIDAMNRKQVCFNLPRRECDLVIAGYSVKYRLAIIDRWQELEAKQTAPAIADPQIAAMMLLLTQFDAQKTRQDAQDRAIEHHSARLDGIEAKNSAILDGHGFYSILGYSKLKGVKLDVKQSAAMGKKATSESKKHGIMMGTVPDARHGTVKTYHSDVLEIVFA